MNYVDHIIRRVGGLRLLSRLLGHKYPATVVGWKNRGSIPDAQKPRVVEAARKHGVELKPEDFWEPGYWN